MDQGDEVADRLARSGLGRGEDVAHRRGRPAAVALSLRPCARGNEPIVLAAYLLARCTSWSRWWL